MRSRCAAGDGRVTGEHQEGLRTAAGSGGDVNTGRHTVNNVHKM